MFKDLNLASNTLTLADVARTVISVCSFTGDPMEDRLDEDDFARCLYYCAEAKTYDGLVRASKRVDRFVAHEFFLAVKQRTPIELLWDAADTPTGV